MANRTVVDLARGVPICGFTGINGAGKTLLAVNSAIARMQQGETIYSTVPIESEYGNSKPILSLQQLVHVSNSTIFLDDISVILPSSLARLPPDVEVMLQTLRHRSNRVIWTAPGWKRAHNQLRLVTQGQLNVVPLFRKFNGSPWPTPRLVGAVLLDTTIGKPDETPTKVLRRNFYRPSKLDAWGAYDTHADTPLLGRDLHSSACSACYGSMTRPKHTKERHEHMGLPWYGEFQDYSQDDESAYISPDLSAPRLPHFQAS